MPLAAPVVLSVWVIDVPLPLEAPLTPVCELVQENVVPVTLLVKEIDVALPEQKACEAGVAVTEGTGFTVIVATTGVPEQPFAVGIIL